MPKNPSHSCIRGTRAIAVLTLLAACAPDPSSAAPDEAHAAPRLVGGETFVDHFEARDDAAWSVSNGWSNGAWMVNDWQKSQVAFHDGILMRLEKGVVPTHPFSSGEVQSRQTYGHGYFETRMRAAAGSGIVTGFFTYTGPAFGKPWNEIDVEILGARPTELFATYYHRGKKRSETIDLGFDATRGFHRYGFDWQPGSIRWYVDGRMVFETRGTALPLPDEKQKLMMDLWGSRTQTDWVGKFDESALPATAVFACVAYSPERPAVDRCK